jgi:crotonobetainyl-CoA:carnitine CoA-transferase CaiB-like acyl-CoA transferase
VAEESSALCGLVVLDLSTNLASAYTSQFFADNGAEVIQVEPPGGSPLRRMGSWPFWMRGKKSIILDLHAPADLASSRSLAQASDVVIEAFGARVADRLGLGYEALSTSNPRLIYTTITAFGHTGPFAHLKGYEAVIMAKTGSIYGNIAPGRPGEPVMTAPLQATFAGALLAIQGALLALHEREMSGRGQRVDATLIQGMLAQDTWDYLQNMVVARYPNAFSIARRPTPGQRVPLGRLAFGLLNGYTKDGRWMQFAHSTQRQYDAFVRALGLDDARSNPDLIEAHDSDDPDVRDRWWSLMLEGVRQRTVAEWQTVFDLDRNVFGELYRNGLELLDHPQILHDHDVVEIDDPRLGRVRQPGLLVKMSKTPGSATALAPDVGEHDDELRRRPAMVAPAVPTSAPAGGPPLDGVFIVEMASFFAGPMGSAMLADQGAKIVKLETLEGDPIRGMVRVPEVGGIRALQGKLSVAVDLGTDEGRAIAIELIKRADMVLATFRGGAVERLGLDADSMRKLNPNLIYHHGVGYGTTGPYAGRAAYAPVIAAGSGFARRSGGGGPEGVELSLDQIKDATLRISGVAPGHPDGMAPLGVAIGMLLGLYARDRGMGGQTTETSMLATMGHVLSDGLVDYKGVQAPTEPDPEYYGCSALYRYYSAADGWIVLCAPDARCWEKLLVVLPADAGLDHDERFATADARQKHDGELAVILGEVFLRRTASEWEHLLSDAGVGCAEVVPHQGRLAAGLFENGGIGDQLGMITTVSHPLFDEHIRSTELVRLSRSGVTLLPAELLGQHTSEVLRDYLGYDDERIAELRTKGIIGG